MVDLYENLGSIISDLEFAEEMIQMMVMNGRCESGNRYLREAAIEIRHALSDLSDALFQISTSPSDEVYDFEDDDDEDDY